MHDVIERKLQWLEDDLNRLIAPMNYSTVLAREDIADLSRELFHSDLSRNQLATEFKNRCGAATGYGDVMLAVHAIDTCGGCMINEPGNHELIIDQLCAAVRLHEHVKTALVMREAWPELRTEARQAEARKTASAKHSTDPRQAEKAFVREAWEDWQKDPTRYKFKTDFARDMLEKCEHLKSQKVVEDWCREWEKT